MRAGQVWVETVLYTLIGLVLIGLTLAFLTPKINQYRDKILVEQTINSLNSLNSIVNSVFDAPENRRIFDFIIRRGYFVVDAPQDTLFFYIDDLQKPYSEEGVEIERGKVKIISEKKPNKYSIKIWVNYSGLTDLKYIDDEVEKKFTYSPTGYKLFVENKGFQNDKILINIGEV